ncbi:cell division protein ZipA [Cognatiluteimonas weifangensis]|uniref:Cell division protein ZipA n=1 Tax=Cognatiluteimonas weifangensis TaxID=2303539 RepID=A0A372DKK9_9GAMM|nr:cell division protein ZipA [Luteimonas weifangensis]RFP60125.1 cell division protein ZipA [Luteimonas weifangensis]
MTDVWMLRTGILIAGLLLIAAIYFFGRPRKAGQGRRVEGGRGDEGRRVEPTLGEQLERGLAGDAAQGEAVQAEMELADAAPGSDLGRRTSEEFDKIVTLYIAARAGQVLRGPDIVVAAEKTGLTYGHMNVFHRLVDGRPERGPIFSVANIMKPGSFDMATIQALETPAIAFFLTLPAPVPALDAWEMMLPTAERMTELLDGVLLDEQRNAIGRQRIQYLRDELRAYDRQHEAPPLTRPPRW